MNQVKKNLSHYWGKVGHKKFFQKAVVVREHNQGESQEKEKAHVIKHHEEIDLFAFMAKQANHG